MYDFKINLGANLTLAANAGTSSPATGATELKIRLNSIDILKGMSCLMLFYWHLALAWHTPDWGGIFNWTQIILDWLGPSMFVMMSVVGTMMSQARIQGRLSMSGQKIGLKNLYSSDSLFKTAYLFIVAVFFNSFNFWNQGIFFPFATNIVLFIAIFNLVTPILMRIHCAWKIAAIVVLSVTFLPFFIWCYGGMVDHNLQLIDYSVWQAPGDVRVLLYYLLCDARLEPVYSWSILGILASIGFDGFSRAVQGGDKEATRKGLIRLRNIGLACIAIGIVGSFLVYQPDTINDLTNNFYPDIHTNLPLFLIRHMPQYHFYSVGIISLIFYLVCKKQIIDGYKFPWENKMTAFGQMSLTAFLMSFIGFVIHIQMSLLVFAVFFAIFAVGIVYLFWLWSTKARGFGSFEWLRDRFVNLCRKAYARSKKDSVPQA